MYRLKIYGLVAAGLLLAIILWNNTPVGEFLSQYIENGEIRTLEARFSPEQIMQAHAQEILGEHKQRTFRDSQLRFYPYVLMDVKYPLVNKQTREGVILWSLVDGEMVLNTDTWEKTHGFEDALNANATPQDFKIMNALARNRGAMTLQELQKALHLEPETLGPWIDSARDKHLIIVRGNEVTLHFQNPRLLVAPHTKMNEWIVTKPYAEAKRFPRQYSKSQIERTAYAAFGQDFTVRNMKEVFLPVYTIETTNPDGSVLTSYWNALNGRRINRNWKG